MWGRIGSRPPDQWSFWRFNWIINRQLIAAAERTRPHASGVLLDVGCGGMRARRWFEGRITRYLGVDLVRSPYLQDGRLTAFARGEALPFRDGSVDTVFGMAMLTYLPEPRRMIEEAHRVLRPEGTLILEFTQMVPLHDEPNDYFRFTRLGAAWLLERAGFEVVESIPVGGLMTRVGMSAIAALNRINRGPWRVLTELPVRAAYILLQLGFSALDWVCFDPREVVSNFVVARKCRA